MDKIKLDIDLGALKKIQKMNIQAFKGIAPVAIKDISESLLHISKFDTGVLEMQKRVVGMPQVYEGFANSLLQINYRNIIESAKIVTKSMLALSDTLDFNLSTYLKGIKTDCIIDSIKGIQDIFDNNIEKWRSMSESLNVWNEQIQSALDMISDEDYEILLKDTEYTKDDVIEDFNLLSEELENTSQFYQKEESRAEFSPKQEKERIENNFAIKYPAAYIILVLFGIFFDVLGKVEITNNLIIPFIQNVSVAIEGNQNKYFIKEEKVKVYESSSCRSKVLDTVYYGEEVEEVKNIKMWLEISYINEDGTERIGWIAKRNLMPYKDWKYNSDDLYDIK